MHRFKTSVFIAFWLLAGSAGAQNIGDRYVLNRPGKEIPGHPAAENHLVSHRFPHGTVAAIKAVHPGGGWFEVEVGGISAWIVKKYLGDKVDAGAPSSAPVSYTVGCWNLEWLKEGKSRGFPENTYTPSGPTIPPRTEEDYAAIAEVITRELNAAVLVLNEINSTDGGEENPRSAELDRLLSHLGSSFDYLLAESGGDQHAAILYDKSKVRLNHFLEIQIPRKEVQGEDVFARDPLVAHFTFLAGGADLELGDFVLAGLHLASGQQNNKNHDEAMQILTERLKRLLEEGEELPRGEDDLILAGDLNLDFFDNKKERVLEQMEAGPYDILAEPDYPATRLAEVPLRPKSKIDYVIVTDAMRGDARAVRTGRATVHQDLADGNFETYRRVFSDHFPVTVQVFVLPDDD